jgi:hypothetical protein
MGMYFSFPGDLIMIYLKAVLLGPHFNKLCVKEGERHVQL